MNIHDIYDFDAAKAAREFLKAGFTAVDDIGGQLVHHAEAELMDALGFAADELEVVMDEVATAIGPVFVFRDPARVSRKAAKAWVLARRPETWGKGE